MYRLPLKRMQGQVALALGILLATTNSAAAQPAAVPHARVAASIGFVTVAPPKFPLPKAAPLPIAPPPPVCQYGPGDELGITPTTQHGYLALCVLFPQVTAFGGFRAGDQDHGTGTAIDCMISDEVAGEALAEFILAHGAEFNVKYVIYKQRIRYPGGDWQPMEDRGSPTANHMDHVHVSFNE
ncbi:hypothetical protein [Smaragdicoccus niigatensis]|uniref:hypothetical protein n=2 Tax=Smaragdicoccus niigatensis TaxID=359359 RepID=UPI000372ABE9